MVSSERLCSRKRRLYITRYTKRQILSSRECAKGLQLKNNGERPLGKNMVCESILLSNLQNSFIKATFLRGCITVSVHTLVRYTRVHRLGPLKQPHETTGHFEAAKWSNGLLWSNIFTWTCTYLYVIWVLSKAVWSNFFVITISKSFKIMDFIHKLIIHITIFVKSVHKIWYQIAPSSFK